MNASILDPRADNYFNYDKEANVWVIAQTWHVHVHKTDEPADKYELVYFRAARKFDTEPTDAELAEFNTISLNGVTAHMDAGTWAGGVVEGDTSEPFTFDKWAIKDIREG